MSGDEEVIGFVIANETGDIYSAGRFPPAVHHQRYHLLTEWDSRFGDGIVDEISVQQAFVSVPEYNIRTQRNIAYVLTIYPTYLGMYIKMYKYIRT